MIELENGVKLSDEFMEYGYAVDPCKVTKDDAAKVFDSNSESSKVACHCSFATQYGGDWTVKRIGGDIRIGCCIFTPEMIAIVRKWAGVE